MKRKIETKYRLSLLNWVTIPPTQVANTVFAYIADEKILKHWTSKISKRSSRQRVRVRASSMGLCYQNLLSGVPSERVFCSPITPRMLP